MNLFKRREWALVVENVAILHFQCAEPAEAPAKAAALAEKKGIANWTLVRDPDATYTCQFQHAGRVHSVDTDQRDKRLAGEFGRRYRDSVRNQRLDTLRAVQLRKSPDQLTVGNIIEAFKRYAPLAGISPGTARNYENCLRLVLSRACPGIPTDQVPLDSLKAPLVFAYRESVVREHPANAPDALRRQREGSANSMLNQARGVFSARALDHYRLVCQFAIPASIREFLDAPGFAKVAKEEYRMPSIQVIKATFEDLAKQKELDQDLFVAVWLTLGFGLRKSEIASVKAGWFRVGPQGVWLDLQATVVAGTTEEKSRTKNGAECPSIQASNGAWVHLGPIVASLPPDAYLLQAPTATGRTDEVFRRFSAWMSRLGWDTEKKAHELRAFAGCQVAQRNGIEAASKWLRHSSIQVTQRHYGRYLRPVITDAPIQVS